MPFGAPAVVGPRGLAPERDLIHIFYERGPCDSDHLQLETWNRQLRSWEPHPAHPRVPVETCQLEDSGRLLNELRWRCEDPGRHNPWNVGLDVFDPGVTESCAVGELRGADYRIDIHVSSPTRSHVVRTPDRQTTLRGSVRIDGLEGVAYDVLLTLDRSGVDAERAEARLAAQVQAARSFVESLRPRLGAVRVGLASYPNPSPPPGESRKGRLELPLTADADLLLRALDRVEARGIAGEPAFADGLEHGLNQLLLITGEEGRSAARRVLVVAADGHAAPFDSEQAQPVLFMRLDDLAADARRAGVRLHLLAVGGYAEEPTPLVRDLVARSLGRHRRIPHAEQDGPFLGHVSLPRPTEVEVTSALTGTRHRAPVDGNGHFAVEVPLGAGLNRLRLEARTHDERSQQRDWIVEFDETQYLRLVLEAERERLDAERLRQRKALQVEAERAGTRPPGVGAGPPSAP